MLPAKIMGYLSELLQKDISKPQFVLTICLVVTVSFMQLLVFLQYAISAIEEA